MNKHTETPLHVVEDHTSYVLKDEGEYFIAGTFARPGEREDAHRLALCWNMHDELVRMIEACRILVEHNNITSFLVEIDNLLKKAKGE